jgi:hypothetical protein
MRLYYTNKTNLFWRREGHGFEKENEREKTRGQKTGATKTLVPDASEKINGVPLCLRCKLRQVPSSSGTLTRPCSSRSFRTEEGSVKFPYWLGFFVQSFCLSPRSQNNLSCFAAQSHFFSFLYSLSHAIKMCAVSAHVHLLVISALLQLSLQYK